MGHNARPFIIGHRGSPTSHPELTLAGFRAALSNGAQYLEFDLQLSKDYVPFLFHDATLNNRVCRLNGKKLVKPIPFFDVTSREVKKYDCGRNFERKFPRQVHLRPTPILSLASFLDWVRPKRTRLLMELKYGHRKIDRKRYARVALSHLKRRGLLRRTIIQSFDHGLLEAIRKLDANRELSFLYRDQKGFHQQAARAGQRRVSINHQLATPERIRYCQDLGIKVFVWTINKPGQWRHCRRLGIDGCITDDPKGLKKFLK